MEDNTYFKSKQKRIVNAIENAAKIMPKDAPVRDKNLHKDEKEVIGDSFGRNIKDNPYEIMSDDEKQKFNDKAESGVEYRQFQDMMEKTNSDIPTDEDLSDLDENDEYFNRKVQEKYDKFVGELATGKYPYSVKEHESEYKTSGGMAISGKKKPVSRFKKFSNKFRKKVASDMYDNALKRTDIVAKRYNKRTRSFYGNHFQENEYQGPLSIYGMTVLREFLGGKYHLEGLQYKEFCKFSWVWKLFKFIVREKWVNFISKIYTKAVIKLPNTHYYGFENLEDMMESTGGKPYTSLLTNHGINPDVMYYAEDKDGNVVDLKPEYEAHLKKKYSNLTGFNKDNEQQGFLDTLSKECGDQIEDITKKM